MFELDPKYANDLEVIIASIKANFRLGLITAGEQWVQKFRVDQFHVDHAFDEISVVEHKDQEVFQSFIGKNSIDKG